MINITNGKQTIQVTKGAYKALFQPKGWIKVDGNLTDLTDEENGTEEVISEKEKIAKNENLTGNMTEENYEDDYEDEEAEDEEIEIPFSEMSVRQLRTYAKEHNIDVSPAQNKRELREIVEAFARS